MIDRPRVVVLVLLADLVLRLLPDDVVPLVLQLPGELGDHGVELHYPLLVPDSQKSG